MMNRANYLDNLKAATAGNKPSGTKLAPSLKA